ncbi:MAG: CoA protein activase [Syntrophomonadaceae bacterium]
MRVTFPAMGHMNIAVRTLLSGLKLEVVPPPPISKRTLELGIKNSPEFACLPLKINVGNFIEAMERGADTIVMVGGWGPCRFGYYAQVERDILEGLGYEFKMIVLEAPDSRLQDLVAQVKNLGENVSLWEAVKAIRFGWHKLSAVERLERQLDYVLPRAWEKDQAEQLYDRAISSIDAAQSWGEVGDIAHRAEQALLSLHLKKETPMKIGLVGEIYTLLEPAANYEICRLIGRMGAQVCRSTYLTDWLNDHLLGGLVKKSVSKQLKQYTRPYLNHPVGGHGWETVGHAVHFARMKCDGIIQIGPLTCMPEIVAQSILPSVSAREGIPAMTLWFDELSATAGLVTRLEAFIDMIERQRIRKNERVKEA